MLLLMLACRTVLPPSELVADTLVYRFETDWTGSHIDEQGRRCFETDQGYWVCLERAQVSLTHLEMSTCEPPDTGGDWTWDTGVASLLFGSRPAMAHIGHSHDVSQLQPDVYEDLGSGEGFTLEVVPGAGAAYCQIWVVHGLSSPEGFAVHLKGSWTKGDTTGVIDSQLGVSLSTILDVGEGAWSSEASPEVVITRTPARALDGLDLASLSGLQLGWAFLEGLSEASVLTWTLPGPPE